VALAPWIYSGKILSIANGKTSIFAERKKTVIQLKKRNHFKC